MGNSSASDSGREARLEALSRALWEAEESQLPIDPLTEEIPDLSLAEAYRVQRLNLDRRLARGERLVGHKIGLTSEAMQQQLGVDQPDVGGMTDRMVMRDGAVVEVSTLIAPRLEAEFAFRLGTDIAEPITYASVRAALGAIMVSAEIIDSRISDWRIKLADTVADNASYAAVVFGQEVPVTEELLDALPSLQLTLQVNGETVAEGAGAAVLGDPVRAVLWLARELAPLGISLKAGELILAGAVHASVPLLPGAAYTVVQGELPSLGFTTR